LALAGLDEPELEEPLDELEPDPDPDPESDEEPLLESDEAAFLVSAPSLPELSFCSFSSRLRLRVP
jgi:hypothetical protein